MRSRFSLGLALSSSVVATATATNRDEQHQQQHHHQQSQIQKQQQTNRSNAMVSDSTTTISRDAKHFETTPKYRPSIAVGNDHPVPNHRIVSKTRTLRNSVSPEPLKPSDAFDPSQELGILDQEHQIAPNTNNDSMVPFRGLLEDAANTNTTATIANATSTHTSATSATSETTMTATEQFDCGTNRPLVGNTINFSRLVHTCLSTPDDCPYDAQHLECWNTSLVEDMSYAFYGMSSFDQPIGGWDTASVTDMRSMLRGASCFNQPIGGWETSSVQDTRYMFREARLFHQPIERWNTSSVTNMRGMFRSAYRFNQPLGEWALSSVQTTREMFFGAVDFDQVLDTWQTSAITDTQKMFFGAVSFNQPIDSWEMSLVTDTEAMFDTALSFNQCLSSWDLSAATATATTTATTARSVSTANMFAFSGCPSANNWCDGLSSPLYPELCDENFVPISEDPWCQGPGLGCDRRTSSTSDNVLEFTTTSAGPKTDDTASSLFYGTDLSSSFSRSSGGNSLSPSRWDRNPMLHRLGVPDAVSNGLVVAFVFGLILPNIVF